MALQLGKGGPPPQRSGDGRGLGDEQPHRGESQSYGVGEDHALLARTAAGVPAEAAPGL